ncbi:MAG: hypothetical protein CME70_14520 [Halobacteriovorax sp.]|nr:hypothetical protein [Halobacteriovorax sp.]|tara:strand:+ start:234288 stop:236789 length:2502 start_codon:yes stop_codon:yes gene_type:complete
MKATFLLILILVVSCSDKVYRYDFGESVLATSKKELGSNTASTLMGLAIKEVNNLDIVLFPSDLLVDSKFSELKLQMSDSEIETALGLYDLGGAKDNFKTGRMTGKQIKRFLRKRNQRANKADLHTVGVSYKLELRGGIVENFGISGELGESLDLNRVYKVAISDYFYFNNATFPGYFYGNGLNRDFTDVQNIVSAKESLKIYLKSLKELPFMAVQNSIVVKRTGEDLGLVKIYEIQGESHRSKLLGNIVKTRGVVTALGSNDRFPKGFEFYIQDIEGDNNPRTSDGVRVFKEKNEEGLKLGDLVEVKATVFEEVTGTRMSRTSLMDVNSVKILSRSNALPKAVKIGIGGRDIPNARVSSWVGDLNFKPGLDLEDGIDFWESLEGMRLKMNDLRIVGFRGGYEEYDSQRPKDYLNLYIIGDAKEEKSHSTWVNGIMIDPLAGDFNPEIVQIVSNHLSKGIPNKKYFNVGDLINGAVEGVLTYEMNIFGDGEFSIVLPESQDVLINGYEGLGEVKLENRPITKLTPEEDQLTIATFNIENLSADQTARVKRVGMAIKTTLKCPDVVNLVEVQDNNGEDFSGGSAADRTMSNIIDSIDCGDAYDYRPLNIDPVNHHEGGVPGGNIRVAMIYNAKRLGFEHRPPPSPMSETIILDNGSINYNPGRVSPTDIAFKGTRKSIIAEFTFKGEPVFVIGNHFNSKLGDSSAWSAIQPVTLGSEERRARLAMKINEFVGRLSFKNPKANIAVVGDFNAYMTENPMRVLEGNLLKNLMTYGNLWPEDKRYTTNFNGSSQALDYIFVNENLLKKDPEFEVLHINSDYMGRLSDHDPLISRFRF